MEQEMKSYQIKVPVSLCISIILSTICLSYTMQEKFDGMAFGLFIGAFFFFVVGVSVLLQSK